MKSRILLITLVLFLCPISIFAQQTAPIASIKLGKLIPGDKLRVTLFRKPDVVRYLGEVCKFNLTLTFTVKDDGTISVPLFGTIPTGGLSISQLAATLQARYDSYFAIPPDGCTTTPPHVSIQYIKQEEKTAMEALIERMGKMPTTR